MKSELLIVLTAVLGIFLVISILRLRAAKCAESRAKQKLKETIQTIISTDTLTGLPNRAAFMEQLEKAMMEQPQGELLAVLDFDIDNFKVVNDTLGLLYGDAAIEAVSKRVMNVLGAQDLLGKVGGDEFVLLLPSVPSRTACEQKVRELMRLFKKPFRVLDKEVVLSISLGAVIVPLEGCTTLQTTMQNLDVAVFQAKESGKNTYCFFDSLAGTAVKERMEMQADLVKAIEEDQFELYYQPQVSLRNKEMTGFEVLVRWNHPKKGLIMPSEFIPVAEESGLIVAIGKMILRNACRQLYEWEQEGHNDIMIAVNLSAKQFRDPFFINTVYDILNEYRINPKNLELEITETIALDNIEYSIRTIERLRQLGITFSLDDFGTGYSSLSYLKRLPVNNLKIDKSFLDSVMENYNDKRIIETIIHLAQVLNLAVIAEGVEQEEQETFLRNVNCNKAQGFLYSKPVTGKAATALLR